MPGLAALLLVAPVEARSDPDPWIQQIAECSERPPTDAERLGRFGGRDLFARRCCMFGSCVYLVGSPEAGVDWAELSSAPRPYDVSLKGDRLTVMSEARNRPACAKRQTYRRPGNQWVRTEFTEVCVWDWAVPLLDKALRTGRLTEARWLLEQISYSHVRDHPMVEHGRAWDAAAVRVIRSLRGPANERRRAALAVGALAVVREARATSAPVQDPERATLNALQPAYSAELDRPWDWMFRSVRRGRLIEAHGWRTLALEGGIPEGPKHRSKLYAAVAAGARRHLKGRIRRRACPYATMVRHDIFEPPEDAISLPAADRATLLALSRLCDEHGLRELATRLAPDDPTLWIAHAKNILDATQGDLESARPAFERAKSLLRKQDRPVPRWIEFNAAAYDEPPSWTAIHWQRRGPIEVAGPLTSGHLCGLPETGCIYTEDKSFARPAVVTDREAAWVNGRVPIPEERKLLRLGDGDRAWIVRDVDINAETAD